MERAVQTPVETDSEADVAVGQGQSGTLLAAAWRSVVAEPARFAALSYFWLTAIGFARLFGSGMRFDVNAVELASPSDFVVAGLRDPIALAASAISGIAILWVWKRSTEAKRWAYALGPITVAFLAVAIFGSASYRHAVVAGAWNDEAFAPKPMAVTMDDEEDGKKVVLCDLRLVLVTSTFVVFHRAPNETVVLKRDAIERMQTASADLCVARPTTGLGPPAHQPAARRPPRAAPRGSRAHDLP